MAKTDIKLPQDKGWTRLGPGAGGGMFNSTLSPHDPNTLILTCDMTGQYLTRDAGRSWRMCNLMIWCDCFAFDPIDPKRIYAGSNAVYATDDFAQSWQMLWPSPDVDRETHLHGDESSPVYLGEGWPGGRVSALAIDPSNNSRLLAGLAAGGPRQTDGNSAVYLSEDRAKTWRKIADLAGARVHRLAIDPRAADSLWAVTAKGLYHSQDSGADWSQITPSGASQIIDGDVGFAADGRTLVYLLAADPANPNAPKALLISRDAGRTWQKAEAGAMPPIAPGETLLGEFSAQVLCVCRDHPETAYLAVTVTLAEPDRPEPPFGILKTTDAGETWQWVLRVPGADEPDNYEFDWLTEAYGSRWGECPLDMGVSPTDPNICYATDYGRCYMTDDGGRQWRHAMNYFDAEHGSYTRGLDITTCYGVHFDPHDPDLAFISYTDIALHKSRNRGLSWHHSLEGVPRAWRNTCYWLVFDPDLPGKIWSVWSAGHDYPRLKMFRRGDPARYPGGVCLSEDSGETWRPIMNGLEEAGCPHIVLDTSSPPGNRTLYVLSFGRGLYKSTDDGASWNLHNQGLPADNLNAWRLAGDPPGDMYLLIFRNFKDGKSIPGGIFRTTDGATTWERLPVSDEMPAPNDLCLAPDDPNVMYAAGWPITLPDRVARGGILKTTDAGKTWERLPFPGEYVYAVSIDPRDPGVIYATAWHHGVFRSEDGGLTWARLGGANFGWPHRVVFDPFDADKIYLTTFGGSVWHGPKLGSPGFGPDIIDLPPVTKVDP